MTKNCARFPVRDRQSRSPLLFARFILALLAGAGTSNARCEDGLLPEPAEAANPLGLIGRYWTAGAADADDRPLCVRIDPGIAFDWSDGMPDDRMPPGAFVVQWEGQVRIDQDGEYRFSAQAEGPVQIWLDGKPAFSHAADKGQQVARLTYGYHPIRVRYAANAVKPQIRLIWSSNHFASETVNPRYLAHQPSDVAGAAETLSSERGRELVERYGCARCHPIPGVDRSRRPGLAMPQASQMNRDWLARWLRDPQAVRPGTRMGSPGGTPAEIEQFVALLQTFLQQPEIVARIEPRWRCGHQDDPLDRIDLKEMVHEGRRRFYELGCSACHWPERPTAMDATRAPSLADVGGKWSKAYLRQLLADPVGRHPNGGMPQFKLNPGDLDGLVAYLSTFGALEDRRNRTDPKAESSVVSVDPRVLEQGKKLIQKRGCYACHHHPENKLMNGPVLSADAVESKTGCLRRERSASVAPFFRMSGADRAAIGVFLVQRPRNPSPVASGERAERILRERLNCYSCHTRNGSGGVESNATVGSYLGTQPSGRRVAMTPPDLSGSGARLASSWMLDALGGDASSNRPALSVQMPRFSLDEATRRQIARRLAFADAIPGLAAPPGLSLQEAHRKQGGLLIESRGFNCVNCHYRGQSGFSRAEVGSRPAPGRPAGEPRLVRPLACRSREDHSRNGHAGVHHGCPRNGRRRSGHPEADHLAVTGRGSGRSMIVASP